MTPGDAGSRPEKGSLGGGDALGFLPSPLRFAVVGAPKCGTTSLVDYLRQTGVIFMPQQKEVPFFVHAEKHAMGEEYLRLFYVGASAEQTIGIAHVHMLRSQAACDRLATDCPNAVIICVCRNPIDRAYSAYWHMRRLRQEPAESFEEALSLEAKRAEQKNFVRTDYAYVGDGEYSRQIEMYRARFGAERVVCLLTEDLDVRPEQCVERVLNVLGLAPDTSEVDFEARSNVAGTPRSQWLHDLMLSRSWFKKAYKRWMPAALQYRLRMKVKKPLLRANLKREEYVPMRADTRARLAEHFRPHNAKLAEMLGVSLANWT